MPEKKKQPDEMDFLELIEVVKGIDLEPIIELIDRLKSLVTTDALVAHRVLTAIDHLLHDDNDLDSDDDD